MKKICFAFLFLNLLFLSITDAFVICNGTDSINEIYIPGQNWGDNPYIFGLSTGTYPWWFHVDTGVPDRCRLNNQKVSSCSGFNCSLVEYYCKSDGYLFWHIYPNITCSFGAIV